MKNPLRFQLALHQTHPWSDFFRTPLARTMLYAAVTIAVWIVSIAWVQKNPVMAIVFLQWIWLPFALLAASGALLGLVRARLALLWIFFPYSAWALHLLLAKGSLRVWFDVAAVASFAIAIVGEGMFRSHRLHREIVRMISALTLFLGSAMLFGLLTFVGDAALPWALLGVLGILPAVHAGMHPERALPLRTLGIVWLLGIECFWIVLLFPFGYLTKGFLFAILCEGLLVYWNALLQKRKKEQMRIIILGIALLLMIFLFARWQ